jgi:hypothetical protein
MSDHGQGTGEYKLIVAILVTYIHDLRRHYLYWLNSFLLKTPHKGPLRQEPFNMKILFSMAEIAHTGNLCDLIGFDHKRFVNCLRRLFPMPENMDAKTAKTLLDQLHAKRLDEDSIT